jgi:hypothetical protein
MKIKFNSTDELADLKVGLKEMVKDGEILTFTIDHCYDLAKGRSFERWQHFFTYPELPDYRFKKYGITVVPDPNLKNKLIYEKFNQLHTDLMGCQLWENGVSLNQIKEDKFLIFREEESNQWWIDINDGKENDCIQNECITPDDLLYFEILEKINNYLELKYAVKIKEQKDKIIADNSMSHQSKYDAAVLFLEIKI